MSNKTEIKRGDVVRLKSGGPAMTVGQVLTSADEIVRDGERLAGACICAWFEVARGCAYAKEDIPWGEARHAEYHVEQLIKIGEVA